MLHASVHFVSAMYSVVYCLGGLDIRDWIFTQRDSLTLAAGIEMRAKILVLVKMYGNSPRKLFVKIMRNSDVRMNTFLLFSFPFLRIVFISWCNLFIKSLTIILFRGGISHILDGINKSPVAVIFSIYW